MPVAKGVNTAKNQNKKQTDFSNEYQKYYAAFEKYGITPKLSESQFNETASKWSDTEGGLAGLYEKELYPAVAKKLNELKKQEYTYDSGGKTIPSSNLVKETYSGEDWRGNGAEWMLKQVDSLLGDEISNLQGILPEKEKKYKGQYELDAAGNIKLDSSGNPVKKAYQLKKNIAEQAFEDIILKDAGMIRDESGAWIDDPNYTAPTFTRPTYEAEKYSTPYMEQIQRNDQPFIGEAQKRLSENLNFINPYGVGSGSWSKANRELQANIAANQALRAESAGKSDYAYDVARAENEYNKAVANRLAARHAVGKLGTYYRGLDETATERDRADRLFDIQNTLGSNLAYNERLYANADRVQAIADAERIARLYEPPEQNAWMPILQTGATALGYALGGPVGGAIGTGIGGMFAPKQYAQPTASYYSQPFNKRTNTWSGDYDYNQMRRYYGG